MERRGGESGGKIEERRGEDERGGWGRRGKGIRGEKKER